jgi:predicted RNase H-like HicB family nuclease
MMQVVFRAEVFEEDGQFVSLCPELNVSSFGDTSQDAKDSLHEAVEAFLEGCTLLGTLDEVLDESGFRRQNGVWRLRERVIEEQVATVS